MHADSQTWQDAYGVTIYDPDGWDRTDFDRSWSELITREEFMKRFGNSTVLMKAPMRSDEEAEAWIRERLVEGS